MWAGNYFQLYGTLAPSRNEIDTECYCDVQAGPGHDYNVNEVRVGKLDTSQYLNPEKKSGPSHNALCFFLF
jgi:hypothetical protein